jgi:quinol monooxygenase YgiN
MPFFVAIYHQAFPGLRDRRAETIRTDYAASSATQPGRKFARLFEHLTDESQLMAFEEWQDQATFERHVRSPAYAEAIMASGPPPRPEQMARLQHYRHMPHRPAALACTAVSSPPDRAAEVETFICDEERRDALVAEGLVLRAVYRLVASPERLLVLHGWRSVEHLERYLTGTAMATAATLATHGATIDQFAGRVAAEFSWLET